MSKAFLKRYLKLLPHRVTPHVQPHIGPVVVVIVLVLATIFGISQIPRSQDLASNNPPPESRFSPTGSEQIPPPDVSARNVFILNIDTNEVIYQKNADEQIYPASTTKIVSALVIFKHFKLEDVITVDNEYPEGQGIGVVAGEQFTVEKLLYALLIYSANDVAEVFAHAYPGGRAAFVDEMNNVSKQYGLQHTQFKNPTGLDEEGHYSSAADLTRLAAIAMKSPLFKRIVSTENSIITTQDARQEYLLTNTNELLGKIPGVLGVKTGFTDKAGESLISEVNREEKNIIVAVLGSKDRFGDTKKLIDWVYASNDVTD